MGRVLRYLLALSAAVALSCAAGDETPPRISFVASDTSVDAPARVLLTATATDDVAVQRVEFHEDGHLRATRFEPPYTFEWQTAHRAPGRHWWTAVAFDTSGNQASSVPQEFEVSQNGSFCGPLAPIKAFVLRDGSALKLEGHRFEAVGANLYYLPQQFAYARLPGQEATRDRMREVLDLAVCLGVRVIRLWGFNEGTNDVSTMRIGPGIPQETGLVGLDEAIAEAKERGLRVIVTLTNNWPDFGGLEAYARWAGKRHDDFFTDAQMQGYWTEWATTVTQRVNTVTHLRYRDEPAILGWEIANELRCSSCGSSEALVATVDALSRQLAVLAPFQLVSDGGEGFDERPEQYPGLSNAYVVEGHDGTSYARIAALPEIDLASAHFYPASWNLNTGDDARAWFDAHADIARKAGKVPYLGEFAFHGDDPARAEIYDAWMSRALGWDGVPIAAFWQLVSADRPDNDGFAIYATDIATNIGLAGWAR